jgi:general secretion pathway protein G
MANVRRRHAGFSRLEFAVVAGVFGLLVAALVERVHFYNEQAELVVVQQLTGTLRTALQVKAAQQLAAGSQAALAGLAQENPLGWLSEKPSNYLGEYYSPNYSELPPGNWLFDRTDHSLVYLPESHKTFSFQTSKFLKFKVKFIRLPGSVNAERSKAAQGVVLDQVVDEVAVNITRSGLQDPRNQQEKVR